MKCSSTKTEAWFPMKIIIPKVERQDLKVDNFDKVSHTPAMITTYATGDDFALYVIALLKILPKYL